MFELLEVWREKEEEVENGYLKKNVYNIFRYWCLAFTFYKLIMPKIL